MGSVLHRSTLGSKQVIVTEDMGQLHVTIIGPRLGVVVLDKSEILELEAIIEDILYNTEEGEF